YDGSGERTTEHTRAFRDSEHLNPKENGALVSPHPRNSQGAKNFHARCDGYESRDRTKAHKAAGSLRTCLGEYPPACSGRDPFARACLSRSGSGGRHRGPRYPGAARLSIRELVFEKARVLSRLQAPNLSRKVPLSNRRIAPAFDD